MQPTHVNAYRVELAEAEKAEAQAHAKVETLRETIATMEQTQPNEPVEAEETVEETPAEEEVVETSEPAEEVPELTGDEEKTV